MQSSLPSPSEAKSHIKCMYAHVNKRHLLFRTSRNFSNYHTEDPSKWLFLQRKGFITLNIQMKMIDFFTMSNLKPQKLFFTCPWNYCMCHFLLRGGCESTSRPSQSIIALNDISRLYSIQFLSRV